ncbi:MAG: hypothetical protein GF400_11160 [Candidatus Eisenbacteria bacterium]|nr:hypothetical protein [Candidatus Eisenbacteria bacterium]
MKKVCLALALTLALALVVLSTGCDGTAEGTTAMDESDVSAASAGSDCSPACEPTDEKCGTCPSMLGDEVAVKDPASRSCGQTASTCAQMASDGDCPDECPHHAVADAGCPPECAHATDAECPQNCDHRDSCEDGCQQDCSHHAAGDVACPPECEHATDAGCSASCDDHVKEDVACRPGCVQAASGGVEPTGVTAPGCPKTCPHSRDDS